MKTKSKKRNLKSKRIRTKTGSTIPLIERKNVIKDGELSREDFETLGATNLANDLGDDEQLKYWEELSSEWAGSEMEETDTNIDKMLEAENAEL